MLYEILLPILLIIVVFTAVSYFRKKLTVKTFKLIFIPVVFISAGVLWYYAIFTDQGSVYMALLMTFLAVYQLFFKKENRV